MSRPFSQPDSIGCFLSTWFAQSWHSCVMASRAVEVLGGGNGCKGQSCACRQRWFDTVRVRLAAHHNRSITSPFFRPQEARKHARATTTQKCVRTNDIGNVGVTARWGTCLLHRLNAFSKGCCAGKQRGAPFDSTSWLSPQAPHVLRDAGELLVWGLLQEGGYPVCLGAGHAGALQYVAASLCVFKLYIRTCKHSPSAAAVGGHLQILPAPFVM